MKLNDVVTVSSTPYQVANTYLVHSISEEGEILLYHTRYPSILLSREKSRLNLHSAMIKGDEEVGLDFCRSQSRYLDFEENLLLESLELTMVVIRYFSKRMKQSLASLLGKIAAYHLGDDLDSAMKLISENHYILNDFNKMWVQNFTQIFEGKQPVTSKRQRESIFNIAGFVLSHLPSNKKLSF